LKGGDELRKLGIDNLLKNPKNLILIEWADLVADVLPDDTIKMNFEFVDDQTRKITL
jgi:tRNA A37 threonylcarbamoyladenosine biosynthesis protein TsaE